tara:strand:- start:572 stop:2284 length:1713 start_codon:yes stop_codon:yes gene_type:complete
MGEKTKNVICSPSDAIEGLKRQIFELISLKQTTCNNLPNLEIPNVLPGVPDLNPSQAVIDFLNDLLSVINGINYDEMRMQLINWLVEKLSPLAKDLSLNLKLSLKSCYACKIDPKIPGWLFQIQPGTIQYDSNGSPIPGSGTPGLGYNVEINKLDLTCLFAANPNSEVGQLFYDGDSDSDMNAFLWEVIQENGNPLIWSDPINGREIAEFRYYENSPIAFIESSSAVDYQDIEPRPRVINVRIMDSYHNKSLITFINDYFNSQNPLFDVDKVIPSVIDLIYGTLTNKISLPDECLNKVVEFEESVKDYIDNGIDNPEIVFDDSFYEFSPTKLADIKKIVREKKLGVKQFKKCCGKQTSSISYETLNTINKDIKSSTTLQNKIKTYTSAVDNLINESTEGVKNLEKGNASAEFLANFIVSLQIALSKLVLSPKNLLLMNMLYFLVNGEPVKEVSIKKILKEYECVIRDIIGELIRKLIYEYLLPLVLRALKDLIICYITKKIKEMNLQYIKSLISLLPPAISDKLEKANELFGKAQGAADKLAGFTDSININSLNNVNINLQSGSKGRFCD